MNYDAVGYASVGGPTVGVSAAHHTLPMPSYVEVTSLTSGAPFGPVERRGPMDSTHAIELSPAAIAQLGLSSDGRAPVRVRRVNPLETERALLRSGMNAPERMVTPKPLLAVLQRRLATDPNANHAGASLASSVLVGAARDDDDDAPVAAKPVPKVAVAPVAKPAPKVAAIAPMPVAPTARPVGMPPVNGASYAAPYAPPRFTAVAPVRTPTELAMAARLLSLWLKLLWQNLCPSPKRPPSLWKPASARQRRRFRADLSCNMAPLPKRLAHKLWPMPQGRKWWAEALSGAYGQPLMHRARPPKPLWLKPRRLVIPKRDPARGLRSFPAFGGPDRKSIRARQIAGMSLKISPMKKLLFAGATVSVAGLVALAAHGGVNRVRWWFRWPRLCLLRRPARPMWRCPCAPMIRCPRPR
jgi:hypothetical protein